MRILLIEDDVDIASNIADYLSSENIIVDFAYDGEDGLQQARTGQFDVILLDVNLPRINGFDLCRLLRTECGDLTPVIYTTARGDLVDRLEGFDVGGWDYLVKPFSLAELGARIRALTLRQLPDRPLRVGSLTFIPRLRRLCVDDRAIHLPNIAFRLLAALMQTFPDVLSRERLIAQIWGEEEPDSSPLRSHVSYLRKQLKQLETGVRLEAVRGFGYILIEQTLDDAK